MVGTVTRTIILSLALILSSSARGESKTVAKQLRGARSSINKVELRLKSVILGAMQNHPDQIEYLSRLNKAINDLEELRSEMNDQFQDNEANRIVSMDE